MRQTIPLLLFALAGTAGATAQIPDTLVVDGEPQALNTRPLDAWLAKDRARTDALRETWDIGMCSAAWSGFRATWELRDDRLWLLEVEPNPCDGDDERTIPLSAFGGRDGEPLAADWVDTELVLPQGELVEYVHMGFESRYERYVVYVIEGGRVVSREERASR